MLPSPAGRASLPTPSRATALLRAAKQLAAARRALRPAHAAGRLAALACHANAAIPTRLCAQEYLTGAIGRIFGHQTKGDATEPAEFYSSGARGRQAAR